MAIKERFTIREVRGQIVLDDEGTTCGIFDTEAEAKERMRQITIEDGAAEFIEDAIIDLKTELVQRFGLTRDQAHNLIRESL